jgi:hypothetical protein
MLRFTGAAVPAPALHGVQYPTDLAVQLPNVAGHPLNPGILFCNPGIALLHPGKHLADVLPVLFLEAAALFMKAAVFGKLLVVLGRELGKVRDDPGHPVDPLPHGIQPDAHLGELGRRPVHVIPQDLRKTFQSQPAI